MQPYVLSSEVGLRCRYRTLASELECGKEIKYFVLTTIDKIRTEQQKQQHLPDWIPARSLQLSTLTFVRPPLKLSQCARREPRPVWLLGFITTFTGYQPVGAG